MENLPERVSRALQGRARLRGTTLAEEVVEALNEVFPPPATEPKTIGNSLDWFFGGNFIGDDVLEAIAEHDVIHPEDFKPEDLEK